MEKGKLAFISVAMAGILWGCEGFFVRCLNSCGVYDLQIAEVRFLMTCVIVVVFLLIYDRRLLRFHVRDIWCFLGTGAVSMLLFNYCFYRTVAVTTMGFAVGLQYTAPAFVLILSAIFFHERIGRTKVVTLLLTLLGCLFMSGIFATSTPVTPLDVALAIASGLGYALFSVFSQAALNRGYSPLTITAYTFVFASIAGAFLCDFPQITVALTDEPISIVYFLGNAIGSTVMPYVLYMTGLKHMEASRASMLTTVELVWAAVLGFFAFGEVPSLTEVIGMLLILAAILLLGFFTLREQRSLEAARSRLEGTLLAQRGDRR